MPYYGHIHVLFLCHLSFSSYFLFYPITYQTILFLQTFILYNFIVFNLWTGIKSGALPLHVELLFGFY